MIFYKGNIQQIFIYYYVYLNMDRNYQKYIIFHTILQIMYLYHYFYLLEKHKKQKMNIICQNLINTSKKAH